MRRNKAVLDPDFWISETGYLATCFHVVAGDPNAIYAVKSAVDPLFDLPNNTVVAANWQIFGARVVAQDQKNDLAILKVDVNPFTTNMPSPLEVNDNTLTAHYAVAKLEPKLPALGERILLAGYPLGLPYPIVQEGVVASIRDMNGARILLSMVANPGNSGGPVLDDNSNVIGILNAGIRPQNQQTGIAIAVPAYYLAELMKKLPH